VANILLVEPDYDSKFPPLGLMRIATYYKERGDAVTFVRGLNRPLRSVIWNRVYVSSLFTYELPRTVKTLKYYRQSVEKPEHLIVGGIGVTLHPEYVRQRVDCRIVQGQLIRANMIDDESLPIAYLVPDYGILEGTGHSYHHQDSYFCRATLGCIRRCSFCAVPRLEPEFKRFLSLHDQVKAIAERYGEKQHLILLDNNVLAADNVDQIVAEIVDLGFGRGAKRNNRLRVVDFTQGIDARLVNENTARLLSSIALSPVRLALDFDAMEPYYRNAIELLAREGFQEFTTYIMYNFDDTPESFYHRMRLNIELSEQYGVRITGFPMRYIPITSVDRHYIGPAWSWRYLRGIQCVLNATRGLVSPKREFFETAFGKTYEDFVEILCMPDDYIIYRRRYEMEAKRWRSLFRSLSEAERNEFIHVLECLHREPQKLHECQLSGTFRSLLEHYRPSPSTELDREALRTVE